MSHEGLWSFYQKALDFFSQGPFQQHFERAKKHYFFLAPVFDENHPLFHISQVQFHEWYFFDCPLMFRTVAPGLVLRQYPQFGFESQLEKEAALALEQAQAGIWIVQEAQKGPWRLKTLGSQTTLEVHPWGRHYVEVGSVICGHLVQWEKQLWLWPGFVAHEPAVQKRIQYLWNTWSKPNDLTAVQQVAQMAFLLTKMRFIRLRYPKQSPQEAYNLNHPWIKGIRYDKIAVVDD